MVLKCHESRKLSNFLLIEFPIKWVYYPLRLKYCPTEINGRQKPMNRKKSREAGCFTGFAFIDFLSFLLRELPISAVLTQFPFCRFPLQQLGDFCGLHFEFAKSLQLL